MKPIITSDLYDEKYCKRINAKQWRFNTIPNVVEILYNHFKPNSVIDIGCANGIHLKAFSNFGCEIFGIEGTKYWEQYIKDAIGKNYGILDIRKPMKHDEHFDLVISFEVLEHLEEQFADQAVKNILSFGNTFAISACPISGGFHHLNPQPREYWIEKFKKFGAEYQKAESEYLQDIFKGINCSGWFKDSLKIFRSYDE